MNLVAYIIIFLEPIERDPLTYIIGADFCLEHSNISQSLVELRCDYNDIKTSVISPAVPLPTTSWLHNRALVFDRGEMESSFFTEGIRFLLIPGFVHPTPLLLTNDDSLIINLQATNVTTLAELTEASIREVLYGLVVGSWTCLRNNSYGTANVTTVISHCGETLATRLMSGIPLPPPQKKKANCDFTLPVIDELT